jgi:RNA polymerase sigma factor (sigma-70 family)
VAGRDLDPASDSGVLLEAARRGEDRALAALLARHLTALRAFVRLQISPFLRARESESDILQSVCLEVIETGERFEYRGEAAFRSWLFGAVLNKIRDRERYYRAQKRMPAGCVHDDAALTQAYHLLSPGRVAAAQEELQVVESAFSRLPERYARALTLHHHAGLSREELARELDTTLEAASVLLRRAAVRLSKELAGNT